MLLLPRAASNIGTRLDLASDHSVTLAILAYCLVGAYQIYQTSDYFGQNWRLLKCITLLEISVLSSAMALSNFSLAYIGKSTFSLKLSLLEGEHLKVS